MPRAPQPVPATPMHAPTGQPLPLPHERDEATGQVAQAPDPVIEQARRDIVAGQVDTDMRATPGLDAERRELLVPTPRPAEAPVGRAARRAAAAPGRRPAKARRV